MIRNNNIDLNNVGINVATDENEMLTFSVKEFDNLFAITKMNRFKIRLVLSDSEVPDIWHKIVNEQASSVRKNFSSDLVESNEILMMAPEEHEKVSLSERDYLEKAIQGTVDVFANTELLHMDLFDGLHIELELVVKHPIESQVINYEISKGKLSKTNITKVPSVTLDTNVVMEYWCEREKVTIVKSLLELAQSGQLDVRVSARIRQDVPMPSLSDRIDELPELGVKEMGSIIRTGCWTPGRDMAGSTKFQAVVDSLLHDAKRPRNKNPDWRDWDHVQTHYLQGRGVFLTWDDGIINAASHLKEELGIVIMRPEEYLHRWNKPIEQKPIG